MCLCEMKFAVTLGGRGNASVTYSAVYVLTTIASGGGGGVT